MSSYGQKRLRTYALRSAIAFVLSSMVAGTALAAHRVDLHGLNIIQLNKHYQATLANTGIASLPTYRHEQLLGLDPESRLLLLKQTQATNGAQNYRYQQTFRGVPIFGMNVIVSEDHRGNVRNLFGDLMQDLASELPLLATKFGKVQALAIGKAAGLGVQAATLRTMNEQSQQMIFIDDSNRAHMSYLVSFFADSAPGGSPTRPYVIVDANSGKILRQWQGLTTAEIGTGPGGNLRTGQYEYGTDFGFNDVAVNGADCSMSNANVKTVDLNHAYIGDTAFVYTCPRNTYQVINGAYSPLNDAHYFGGVVHDMYNTYLGTPPLLWPLAMHVHYGSNYENAFWSGSAMYFGDGLNQFYPLVSLDVSAHEISHGYTEQNSGLVYYGQAGGMNEAYSDIAGEAAEYFFKGSNDFEVAAEIIKAPGLALRYMYDPPLDGHSIDHIADYTDSTDVHSSSGIYNKAFYLLATTQDWTTRTAFQAFAFANRDYWTPGGSFAYGVCGVEQAADDIGMPVADVTRAFTAVGLSCVVDNMPPEVDFSVMTKSLSSSAFFTDSSSDSDGSIVSWFWNFGDDENCLIVTSSTTCPQLSGDNTSTEANPTHTYATAGIYYVTLTATDDDGASNAQSKWITVNGARTYINFVDVAITDNSTVKSPITVSGRTGNAPSSATVEIHIVHSYIGQLKVTLTAPDNSQYELRKTKGGDANNIDKIYTVNLSTEPLNGTWQLKVNDNATGDTGYIDTWSMKF